MNVYEVKTGMVCLQCERFKGERVLRMERYTNLCIFVLSLPLLWHSKYGPIVAAVLASFNYVFEL